jgi:4-carboxymuconolactone decarboxylase
MNQSYKKSIQKGEGMPKLPEQYLSIKKRFGKLFRAVENLGRVARDSGPIDEKTSHLIQIAAAAAIRSEGALHSHTRRALNSGAKPEEIYHTIVLITSTVGFPTVSAALSWADDVIRRKV